MTLIHMETEEVQTLKNLMQEKSFLMQEKSSDILKMSIRMDWDGNSRDEFISQTDQITRRISEKLSELSKLSAYLQAEINQWIEVAEHFGPGAKWLNNNAVNVNENVWLLNNNNSKLSNAFLDLTKSETGQELIRTATDAGLLFVIIENGKEVGWLGDPNGKRIPIKWNEIEGAYGLYRPIEGNEHIEMNIDYANTKHLYTNTLVHEMQHAIDFNTDKLDMDAINAMNNLNADSVANMSAEDLEATFEKGLTEYVKSEVNAHDLGYKNDPRWNLFENVINAKDGVYTKREFQIVVNHRGYDEIYEEHINQLLKDSYGPSSNFQVDVWVDNNGNLQVDIEQSQILVPVTTA